MPSLHGTKISVALSVSPRLTVSLHVVSLPEFHDAMLIYFIITDIKVVQYKKRYAYLFNQLHG